MRSSQGLVRLPRPRRTSRLARHKDYDEFVRAHNDRVEAGRAAGPRLVLVSAVTSGTGLGWNDVLAVARGEAEFEQLQQQRDEERLRADGGPLGLIGSRTVALMLGWSESAVIQMHQRDTGFPRAVIKLNAQSGWIADDIRAYRDRKPFPRRRLGEMQHLAMPTGEVAEALNYTPDSLRSAQHNNSPSIPQRAGKVGTALYWLRADVEAWVKANHARRAPR